jgi:hypothetical protein
MVNMIGWEISFMAIGAGRKFNGAICVIVMLIGTSGQASADDPFVGRWAIDPAGCMIDGDTSSTAPMYVTEKTVKWFVANCLIKKSYRIGDTLALQAQCSNEGRLHVMPIGLKLIGKDRISVTWDKALAGEMRRCK